MLYSATLSYRVVSLARNHLNDPVRVSVHPEELVLENIAQELYHVAGREKVSLLLGLIEREQPRRSMVFVNTKRGGEELAWRLNQNNAKAVYISGDLPQNRRSKIIEQMKDGQITMLVATDVASRGLHVEDVTHVFNYDVPQDPEDYIHRIGRTGRVGASGKAITLACDDYVYCLPAIEDFIKMKIPAHQPTDELLADDTSGYYRSQRPTGKGRSRDGKRPRRGGGRRPGRRSDSGGRSHKGNGHGHAKAEERPRQMSSAAKKTAPRKDADSAPRKRVRRRIGDGQGLGE